MWHANEIYLIRMRHVTFDHRHSPRSDLRIYDMTHSYVTQHITCTMTQLHLMIWVSTLASIRPAVIYTSADESCRQIRVSCSWVTHLNTRVRMDEWVMEHMMSCVTHEWVMSYMGECLQIWVRHVTFEGVMSQVMESWHVWVRHVTYDWVIALSHVTGDWVMARMSEACHIWLSHSTESCPRWLSHGTCEWGMSHMIES